MKIIVKLFGVYQQLLPKTVEGNSVTLDLMENSDIDTILKYIKIPINDQYVVLINGLGMEPGQNLKDGDAVAIFQSIAGG